MKCTVRFTTLCLLFFIIGCTTHNDFSTSVETISAPIAPHVNWQSDDYTLVEVPQVDDVFYLNANSEQHFLSYYHAQKN